MAVVFALTTCSLRGELVTRITEGEAWDADDPVVRKHPEMFAASPKVIRRTTPARVEQATKAPGEMRRGRSDRF